MTPLFPLDAVLFPGAALPLFIFEPRYQRMITDCLGRDATFGVVRIREGQEVGGACIPYEVGTLAHIVAHRPLDDGRMMLVAEGISRFRLAGPPTWEPYPQAPTLMLDEPALQTDHGTRLRKLLLGYLEAYAAYQGEDPPDRPLPAGTEQVGWLAATLLPADLDERQELLEMMGEDRLLRLIRMLEAALVHVGHLAEISRLRADVVANGRRFSMN